MVRVTGYIDDLPPPHAPDQPSGKADPLEDAFAQQRWKRVVHGRLLLSWRLVMGAHAVLWCLFLHELITDHGNYYRIRYLMSQNGNGQYKSGHHICVLRMSLSFHWHRVIEFRFVSWSRDLGSRRISLYLEGQEKAEANESQCILNGFNFPVCKLFQTTRGHHYLLQFQQDFICSILVGVATSSCTVLHLNTQMFKFTTWYIRLPPRRFSLAFRAI